MSGITKGSKKINKRFNPPSFKMDGVNSPIGKRARIIGSHSATIPSNTSVDIDYKMEQLQYKGENKDSIFNGIQYYAKNADNLDTVTFQVVDKDNILGGGAGAIVEEFGSNIYVMPDSPNEMILYKSRITPGLYLRLKYISTGQSDVVFSMNLFRHLLE